MISAKDAAVFFLKKDPDLFTDDIICCNGANMYEGNARLNKYLHIAQNVYIAKTGELLFEEPLYAYANGGIVKEVQQNYQPIKHNLNNYNGGILSDEIKTFLSQISNILRNATVDELIEISHQDEEWQEKYKTKTQIMDPLNRVEEYREQYGDMLKVMEMGLC